MVSVALQPGQLFPCPLSMSNKERSQCEILLLLHVLNCVTKISYPPGKHGLRRSIRLRNPRPSTPSNRSWRSECQRFHSWESWDFCWWVYIYPYSDDDKPIYKIPLAQRYSFVIDANQAVGNYCQLRLRFVSITDHWRLREYQGFVLRQIQRLPPLRTLKMVSTAQSWDMLVLRRLSPLRLHF